MGNFRSDSRGGFRGRSSGSGFGRRSSEMHDVTCDKCGKQCQVPFRPTGDKPVFCSDCFRKNEGSSSNFNSRNQNAFQSGVSSEQFNKLNAKLDKIIKILETLEIVDEDLEEESEDEDEDEEKREEDSEDEDDSEKGLEEESEDEEEDENLEDDDDNPKK